jgi:NhaP-type Na+/H+ or K+/H+ antiporter
MAAPTTSLVAARVALALSVVLLLVCIAYLFEGDTRELFIRSFSPETRFIALPAGLRYCLAVLVVLNLPGAAGGQFVMWGLDSWAPGLTPAPRAWIVITATLVLSGLWWVLVLRRAGRPRDGREFRGHTTIQP